MAVCNIGSYYGVCPENENMVDIFKSNEKEKDERAAFNFVKKIAIEAPPETKFTVNDTEIVIPSTGIFEVGYGLLNIYNLTFSTSEQVNIVYMF